LGSLLLIRSGWYVWCSTWSGIPGRDARFKCAALPTITLKIELGGRDAELTIFLDAGCEFSEQAAVEFEGFGAA
jgi:hypothetical protein